MSVNQLPEHLAVFVTEVQDNPALVQGASAAVGDRTGNDAVSAAAAYYQSQGYTITTEELLALEASRKSSAGEELSDEELHVIAGGLWEPWETDHRFPHWWLTNS